MTTNDEAKAYLESYTRFAQDLRLWLTGYGIGGPALFVTQPFVSEKIADAWQSVWIVSLFLAGVFLQVFYVKLHKWSQWQLYHQKNDFAGNPSPPISRGAKCPSKSQEATFQRADWVSRQYWIDNVIDWGSVALYAGATIWLVFILTERPPPT
ncbi:MAG: hypothetical protein ABL957_10320 [Parvularculaceae bacterium]